MVASDLVAESKGVVFLRHCCLSLLPFFYFLFAIGLFACVEYGERDSTLLLT